MHATERLSKYHFIIYLNLIHNDMVKCNARGSKIPPSSIKHKGIFISILTSFFYKKKSLRPFFSGPNLPQDL